MMDNATENTKFQQPMDVAEYLFCRLAQLGIKSLFGVPGDYNLVALDYVSKCGLNWVGSVNELNAGYSADGYARIVGIGALVTTFGVGELSAMNALAGSFAEFVPVVHIVGTPSTISQENGMLLHHTLGDGNFSVFANMSQSISCFTARLDRKTELIPGLIDDALRECYLQSRPVYITLPTDIVHRKVDGSRLNSPLNLEFPPNDLSKEDFVVKEILKLLQDAKRPTILIDACTIRHRAIREVRDFVKKSGFPTFVAPMGKGAVDETLPNYGGVYAGNGSHHSVRETVENSDLVFSIGAIKSDFNTTGFTYRTSQLATIDFHSTFVRVKYAEYRGVRMNGVLSKITAHIKQSDSQQIKYTSISASEVDKRDENTITHAWFWPKLTDWFEESDIVITETGTSGYGIWETKFRPGMTAISQILWGSIGYATGAAAGAAFGAEEQGKRRTILFTGDGSFQLTAQELSTMIRHKLNPIIFIICNNGFTIERFIHGMEATYNDIALWKHKELLSAFGARPEEYQWYSISTRPEVEALLANQEFALSSKLRLVEIKMDADDAPLPLKLTAAASAENNAKQ